MIASSPSRGALSILQTPCFTACLWIAEKASDNLSSSRSNVRTTHLESDRNARNRLKQQDCRSFARLHFSEIGLLNPCAMPAASNSLAGIECAATTRDSLRIFIHPIGISGTGVGGGRPRIRVDQVSMTGVVGGCVSVELAGAANSVRQTEPVRAVVFRRVAAHCSGECFRKVKAGADIVLRNVAGD